MPNTLVHFGLQGVTSKALFRDIDVSWVFLGCIIPDIPWIFRRALDVLAPGINPYDLRSYATIQASFLVSVILCGAFAAISKKPRLVFTVLVFNSFLHLVLDAIETKWGNGVHLFAPYSWDLLNFGLLWPENSLISILTLCGFVYSVWLIWRTPSPAVGLLSAKRVTLATILFGVYCSVPFALMHALENQDNFPVNVLRAKASRVGKNIELDRARYSKRDSGGTLRTFAREELRIIGRQSEVSGTVSIRGTFIDPDTIFVHELHHHNALFRDMASYVGLSAFIILWIKAFFFTRQGDSFGTGQP